MHNPHVVFEDVKIYSQTRLSNSSIRTASIDRLGLPID
jgi:hypothetical protein